MRRPRLPRSTFVRLAIIVPALAGLGFLLWWRVPWSDVADAFDAVEWKWVAAAIGFNFASIVARAVAWNTVIRQSMPEPHPAFPLVFSAFSVGLMANAVLPGRVGELARVGVLTRKLQRAGAWATLVGSVVAHRVFDLVPVGFLIISVLVTAKIRAWAITSLIAVFAIGVALFLFTFLSARHHHRVRLDGLSTVRRMVTMARAGLGVMRQPVPAATAVFWQCIGWAAQLLAVWTALRAFDIDKPLPAAALVLLLMNVATILPLWPGNIGLVQLAIALPLVQYGVDYGKGYAFGLGLQAIEASVGVGVGLIFLAREGLSYATLRDLEEQVESDAEEPPERERERPRAGVSG
jgi:uncharacterized protein (TIRG00374 family)